MPSRPKSTRPCQATVFAPSVAERDFERVPCRSAKRETPADRDAIRLGQELRDTRLVIAAP